MLLRSAYMEVDLEKYRSNIKLIQKSLDNKTQLMLVLKDHAYGVGAVELARAAIELGVTHFAVSNLMEAFELRKSFSAIHILILGYIPRHLYGKVVEKNLQLNIWTIGMAKDLDRIAKEKNTRAKVHISVDTGLSRLGLFPNKEGVSTIKEIYSMANLSIEGIFSHFARTETEDDQFSKNQLSAFLAFLEVLGREGIKWNKSHMADSAAIVKFPDSHLDMVRCGALALGSMTGRHIVKEDILYPTREIVCLYAQVARVVDLPKGTSVSYDGSYIAEKDIRVITLAIGYGDGISSSLEGKMQGLIQGKRVEQIGAICMDMMMLDGSGVDCEEGDWLTLLGQDQDQSIGLEDWSQWSGLSPTFLLSMLRDRIPRIYKAP